MVCSPEGSGEPAGENKDRRTSLQLMMMIDDKDNDDGGVKWANKNEPQRAWLVVIT